jgi:hypothetical protein
MARDITPRHSRLLVTQPSLAPSRKVTATAVTAAAATLLVWLAGLIGLGLTEEQAALAVGLLATAAGWLRHEGYVHRPEPRLLKNNDEPDG